MSRFEHGWVKIHRKMFDGKYDGVDIAILTWLIAHANYTDGKTNAKGKSGTVSVKRGQLVTSFYEIAGKLKWTRKTVTKRINNFEIEGIIACEKSHHGTIITIFNYEKYQCVEDEHGTTIGATVVATVGTTVGTTVVTNNEEVKNLRTKELNNTPKKPKPKKCLPTVTPPVQSDVLPEKTAKDVIGYYCDVFNLKFGIMPKITGQEARAGSCLFKDHGLDKAKAMIDAYFKLTDRWVVDSTYPMSYMLKAQVINRLSIKTSSNANIFGMEEF